MKLQLRNIFIPQESAHLTEEQQSEIVKSKMIEELSKEMFKTVAIQEEYENQIEGKVFSAEVIYMPKEQWNTVLDKLRILKLSMSTTPEAKNIINEIVDEIKNR